MILKNRCSAAKARPKSGACEGGSSLSWIQPGSSGGIDTSDWYLMDGPHHKTHTHTDRQTEEGEAGIGQHPLDIHTKAGWG